MYTLIVSDVYTGSQGELTKMLDAVYTARVARPKKRPFQIHVRADPAMVELLDALALDLNATKTEVLFQALQCLSDRRRRANRLPGGGSILNDGQPAERYDPHGD